MPVTFGVGASRAAEPFAFQLRDTDLQLGPRFQQTIFSAEKAAHQEDRVASTMVVGLETQMTQPGYGAGRGRISGVRMILQRYRLTDC
jgi:hypothetical protein